MIGTLAAELGQRDLGTLSEDEVETVIDRYRPSGEAARAFHDPAFPNPLSGSMNTIITHWSAITGHDVKAGKVAVR
jgi:hypothetical protein